MAEIGYASLGIIPSFDGFERRLTTGTTGPMSAAGRAGGDSFGKSFSTRAKRAVQVGAAGVALAAAGAIKFAGDSLAEARDAQKIGAQTRAVIKSTGGAAKVTERSVGRLAERLSDMAGIDDELIQSGGNVLLTFTKIRNEAGAGNAVFDRATEAALNMSVALGSDLKSAAIQVGKALNDPEKGVTALGRAGVQFTDAQKDQIKTLVDSGRQLDAQKMILKELDTQFKGSAKAQATEADKLAVAWGNLKEDLGTELLPVMDDLAVFMREKGLPAAKEFGGWVRDDMVPAVQDLAADLEPVVDFAKDLARYLNDLPTSVKIGGLASLATLVGGMKLRGGGGGALGTAGQALGLAKPVPVFVTNAGGLGGAPGGGRGLGKGGLLAAGSRTLPTALIAAAVVGILATPQVGAWLAEKEADVLGVGKRKPRGDDSAAAGTDLHRDVIAERFRTGGAAVDAYNEKLANTRDRLTVITNGVTGFSSKAERLRDHLTVITNGATIPFKSPSLDDVLSRTRDYKGILEGIDGRVVTTHLRTVSDNNVVPDLGGNGGRTPLGRTTSNVTNINVGEVRAHNYDDFVGQMQRKKRARSGGGR